MDGGLNFSEEIKLFDYVLVILTAGVRLDAVNSTNIDNYFKLLQNTQIGFADHPETI